METEPPKIEHKDFTVDQVAEFMQKMYVNLANPEQEPIRFKRQFDCAKYVMSQSA